MECETDNYKGWDFHFSPIDKARKQEGGRQGKKEKGQKNFS